VQDAAAVGAGNLVTSLTCEFARSEIRKMRSRAGRSPLRGLFLAHRRERANHDTRTGPTRRGEHGAMVFERHG
jgi:hypothetical protein